MELRIKPGGLALNHSTDICGKQSRIVISMGLGVKKASVQVPAQPLTNGMTLAKLFNLYKPQEMIRGKSLAWELEHSESPTDESGWE